MEETLQKLSMEADHVFVLMKRKHRISRNVRARWYFHHLNQTVTIESCFKNTADKDLAIIGASPEGHSTYLIGSNTIVTFLSQTYRLACILDCSPSTAVADSGLNSVLQDDIFARFKRFLSGLVQPFHVPSSCFGSFSPTIYLTVIAYTPFLRNRSRQVLLQGIVVNLGNYEQILNEIESALRRFLNGVVEATAFAIESKKLRSLNVNRSSSPDKIPANFRSVKLNKSNTVTLQVQSDRVLIDMVQFGLLAIRLLPEDTSAGIILFTDGVLGMPNVSTLNSLLTELRILMISCTFFLVESAGSKPDCAFSKVSNVEFMRFLATATFGAYLEECPTIDMSVKCDINEYHRAVLCWNFQRAVEKPELNIDTCAMENCIFHFSPIRYRHYTSALTTSFTSVLSVRLREGYTIKHCKVANGSLQVHLVLPWKNQVCMEYVIVSDWPPPPNSNAKVQIEVWTESYYEFLNDVQCPKTSFSSSFHATVVASFFDSLQKLTQSDKMLMEFESFHNNPINYTIPDSVKNGMPLFYLLPDSDVPVISSKELQQKYSTLCNFWHRLCMLDMHIWQKWLHIHRVTLILTHDTPLAEHLHSARPGTEGRRGSVTCRQAAAAIDQALRDWATFSLLDSFSYVKFEYEFDSEVPKFFYIIRPTFRTPCVFIRLAFLGGLDGLIRHQIVSSLKKHLLSVTVGQRVNLQEKRFLSSSAKKPALPEIGGGQSGMPENRRRLSDSSSTTVQVPACILSRKPVKKILVRYDKIPHKLSFMIQNEELNKSSTAVNNNILCRYFYCKRWIWSTKHPVRGLFVSNEAAASILNTILRARLNEGFRFVYAHDGSMTLFKEYPIINSASTSCSVQFVIHPPVPSAQSVVHHHAENNNNNARGPSRSRSHLMHRDSICSENEQSEPDSLDTNRDFDIVTELWCEPQQGQFFRNEDDEAKLNCETIFQNFYESDRAIVKSMVTFEHLKLLKDDNELRYHSKRFSIPGKSESDSTKSGSLQRKIYDESDEYRPEVDQSVASIPNCFDLCLMLSHCQMATLLFSTLIVNNQGNESKRDDFPNHLFLEAFHHELKRAHDASWIIYTETQVHKFWTLVCNQSQQNYSSGTGKKTPKWKLLQILKSRLAKTPENQLHRLPLMVCYIKAVAAHQLIVVACPKSLDDLTLMWTQIDENEPNDRLKYRLILDQDGSLTLPVFTFNCCHCDLAGLLSGSPNSTPFTFNTTTLNCESKVYDYRNAENTDSVLGSFHRQITMADDKTMTSQSGDADYENQSIIIEDWRCSTSEHDHDDAECREFKLPWFCGQLEALYCRAFVSAVYRSLVSDCDVSTSDVRLAVEGKCEETSMEVDLTEFMETICDHYRQFLNDQNILTKSRRSTMDTENDSGSFKTHSIAETPPIFTAPVCQGVAHKFVKETIEKILGRSFKAIGGCDDFYYYRPPIKMDEPVSECESFSNISTEDADQDQTISFEAEDAETDKFRQRITSSESYNNTTTSSLLAKTGSSGGRSSQKLSFTQSTLTRETLRSLPDLSSSCSSSSAHEETEHFLACAWRYPIFLNVGCSIRLGTNLYTCSIKNFPTCLNEIFRACEFDCWDADLCNMHISFDILILTVAKDDGLQPIVVDEIVNYNIADSVEVLHEEANIIAHPHVDIPVAHKIMLDKLISEVTQTLQNEVYFSFYRSKDLTPNMAARIMDQTLRMVNNNSRNQSISARSEHESTAVDDGEESSEAARFKQIQLVFVLKDAESHALLKQELMHFQANQFLLEATKFSDSLFYAECEKEENNEDQPDRIVSLREIEETYQPLSAVRLRRKETNNVSGAIKDAMRTARAHSFAGFPAVYYSERSKLLNGKWTSTTGPDQLTYDPRTLRRLMLRSEGPISTVENAEADSMMPRLSSTAPACSATSSTFKPSKGSAVSGYEAESSTMAGFYNDDEEASFAVLADDKKFSYASSCPKNTTPDFWLLCHLTETNLNLYFHERSPDYHLKSFEQFVIRLKELLKKVNQKMLLTNLLETRRCDNLLVAEDGTKFENINLHNTPYNMHIVDDDEFEENNTHGYLAADAKCAPNTFACPCVFYRWFFVHPRLKTGAGRVGFNRAVHAMKSLLNKFIVHNRENLYVFKESETGAVFYARLHERPPMSPTDVTLVEDMNALNKSNTISDFMTSPMTEKSWSQSSDIGKISSTMSSTQTMEYKSALKGLQREFTNKILLTVHGVCEPGDEIKTQLMAALENKIKDAVLDQLLMTMERNPNCKLTTEDVYFLQPKSIAPTKVWHFTLPFISLSHLYALNFYLQQHLLDYFVEPNYAPKMDKFRTSDIENCDDRTVEQDSKIFLYYPRDPGRKGMAVVLQSIVDTNDGRIPLLHSDCLQPTCCPNSGGFGSFFRSGHRFKTLLKCAEYDRSLTSIERKKRTLLSSTALIRFAVWETTVVGDTAMTCLQPYLKTAFKNSLEAALIDLVIEYGLLTLKATSSDNLSKLEYTSVVSEPPSPVEKAKHQTSSLGQLRKRHSSAAVSNQAGRMTLFNFDNLQKWSHTEDIERVAASISGSTANTPSLDNRRRHKSHAAGALGASLGNTATADRRSNASDRRLNASFAETARCWLPFAAKAVPQTNGGSVVTARFVLANDAARRSALYHTYDALREYLSRDSDLMCFAGDEDIDDDTTTKINASENYNSWLEGVEPQTPYKPSPKGVATFEYASRKSYTILCRPGDLWRDTIRFGSLSPDDEELPASISSLINSRAYSGRIWQRLLPYSHEDSMTGRHRGFIPRQRLIFIEFGHRQINFYAYNYITECVLFINNLLTRLTCWQNAKSTFLRKICLQKLGFFHPCRINDSDIKLNPYLATQWYDNDSFISHNTPPSQLLPLSKSGFLDYNRTLLIFDDSSKRDFWKDSRTCEPIDLRKTDPVAYHGRQLSRLRDIDRKCHDEDQQILTVLHNWTNAKSNGPIFLPEMTLVRRMLKRCQLVHMVYSPLLFHQGWREKVGQIRQPKQNRPYRSSPVLERSRHSSGQTALSGRPSVMSQNSSVPFSPGGNMKSTGGGGGGSYGFHTELWHISLQQKMAQQYSTYLQQHLGLTLLLRREKVITPISAFGPDTTNSSIYDEYVDYQEMFFEKSYDDGTVILRVFFEEPYFALQCFVLPRDELLAKYDLDNVIKNTYEDDVFAKSARLIIMTHVHSFSYDFHMRIVAQYAAGDAKTVFKPGYNMQAFLSDFLRYYTCRPPYARTYIFEDQVQLLGLPVRNDHLYNHLLDHDKKYGLRVVRMRVPLYGGAKDEYTSEYLLTSHDTYTLSLGGAAPIGKGFEMIYHVLRLLMRDDSDDSPISKYPPPLLQHGATRPTSTASLNLSIGFSSVSAPSARSDSLSLKFYTIFVDDANAFPLERQFDDLEPGKYEEVRAPGWAIGMCEDGESPAPLLARLAALPIRERLGTDAAALKGNGGGKSVRRALNLSTQSLGAPDTGVDVVTSEATFIDADDDGTPALDFRKTSGDGTLMMHDITDHPISSTNPISYDVVPGGRLPLLFDRTRNLSGTALVRRRRRPRQSSTNGAAAHASGAVHSKFKSANNGGDAAVDEEPSAVSDDFEPVTCCAGGTSSEDVSAWQSAADLSTGGGTVGNKVTTTPASGSIVNRNTNGSTSDSSKTKRLSTTSIDDHTSTNSANLNTNATSVQAESATYLTFITDFESKVQHSLADKSNELKENLKVVCREAASHCRRDRLWTKLLVSISNEGLTLRRRDDRISYSEFLILLQLVHMTPVEQMDESIADLKNIDFPGVKTLLKTLSQKYGNLCYRLTSSDGMSECLAILNSNCLDEVFILMQGENKKQDCCSVRLVYKDYVAFNDDSDSTRMENKIYKIRTVDSFWQDFVNTLAYNAWTCLL